MDAGAALGLEGGDPHGLEFVEIAGRDRQEAQPLQQGMMRIARLLQHPAVEGEPGDLAVDESVGGQGQGGGASGSCLAVTASDSPSGNGARLVLLGRMGMC